MRHSDSVDSARPRASVREVLALVDPSRELSPFALARVQSRLLQPAKRAVRLRSLVVAALLVGSVSFASWQAAVLLSKPAAPVIPAPGPAPVAPAVQGLGADSLAAEAQALERALGLARAENRRAALTALDAFDRQFPQAELRVEALSLRVSLQLELGDETGALVTFGALGLENCSEALAAAWVELLLRRDCAAARALAERADRPVPSCLERDERP